MTFGYGQHPHGNRGFVYFAQGEDGGPIKIGFTRDKVAKRIKQIQTMCPVRLVVLFEMPAVWWMELEIHSALADKRLHGEWFEDCDEIRSAIETFRASVEPLKAAA